MQMADQYGTGWASLEGQIADLADSIAYNSHDLDDALACSLISEPDLAPVELYSILKQTIERQFPRAHRYARQLRVSKALIDFLITDVLDQADRRLTKYTPGSVEEVRLCPVKIIALSDRRRQEIAQLESFLYDHVYQHPRVIKAQQQAERELHFLFDVYLNDPGQLPERYQQRLSDQGPHRVICDYLAGMTDRFCHALYKSKFDNTK
jgi:dGTPase